MGDEVEGEPAVVVGTTFACQLPNQLVFVLPCTTTDRDLPFHPQLMSLELPTFAMCDQLKSISRQRLVQRHPARLRPEEVGAEAVAAVTELLDLGAGH